MARWTDRLRPGHPPRLRPASAPAEPRLAICPHCWNVNGRAERLCGRCGADMATHLQESGGLRRTAAVQSPMPVPGGRLSRLQRAIVLGFLALLALAQVLSVLAPGSAPPRPPASVGASP